METTKYEPLYITVKEAAERARMSVRKMRAYISSNTGPRYKRHGQRIVINYKMFLKWCEQDHPAPPPGY
jgi:hypothetical protein